MGFEVYLSGDETQTDRFPGKADIERLFAGLIRADQREFRRLDVGRSESDSCGIYYDEGDGPQTSLMVERPVDSDWLWERLFRLLQDYDLFMFWPDEDLAAVVARADAPVIADMAARKVVATTVNDLKQAIAGAG